MCLFVIISVLSVSFLVLTVNTILTLLHAPGSKEWPCALSSMPRVSILVPAKNCEHQSAENIGSLFALTYSNYEIIFGVDRVSDPIYGLLCALIESHSHIPARIVETGFEKTGNPKISTLMNMTASATGTLVWVCDANVRVEPDTLSSLVTEHTRRAAGIVFSPVGGDGSSTFGSLLENSYLNTFVSGNIITAWALLRKPVIVGKSMLFDRHILDARGGFMRYQPYLAEDYCMGDDYARAGVAVTTNYTWVFNHNATSTVRAFFDRAARWATLRWHIGRATYLLELLTNPLCFALLGALCMGTDGLLIVGLSWLFKTVLEYIVLFSVTRQDRRNIKVLLLLPVAVAVKDILLGIVYMKPFFNATVNWRGRHIRIGARTMIMDEVPS